MLRKLFVVAVLAVLITLSYSLSFASVAIPIEGGREDDYDNRVVVVGSYGGYSGYGGFWGLNDYFMSFLSQYFTLDQMKDIDRQIQTLTGIDKYAYNYMGEGRGSAYGYLYDSKTNSWTYWGYSRVGKSYSELTDKGFVISLETGKVIDVISSREYSGLSKNAQFTFQTSYAELVGDTVEVNGREYKIVGARNWSPIMLDLDGDDVADTNRNRWDPHAPAFFSERTAFFDLSGDERNEFCEWPGAKDGLLVKPEEDGSIRGAENLFGTAGGYRDGYVKMSETLDVDKNGWVEGNELEGLYLWQDKNTDGICSKDELTTVQSWGVQKISTDHKNFTSVYYRNGKKYKTWDWWPTGFEVVPEK